MMRISLYMSVPSARGFVGGGPRPHRRNTATTCTKDPSFVDVCTDKACSKQGSKKILALFDGMCPPHVTVEASGCQGNCGEGPNVMVLPDDVQLTGISSAEAVAAVLEENCQGLPAAVAVSEYEARAQASEAFQRGDFEAAEGLYGKAIAVAPTASAFAARSGVKLGRGDAQGALEDAEAAYGADPEWTGGYLRAADALEALGDSQQALAACSAAYQIDPDLMEDEDFKDRITWLQRVG